MKTQRTIVETAADTFGNFADEQVIGGDISADLDRMHAQAFDTVKMHAQDFADIQNCVLAINKYQDACNRLLNSRRQARESLQFIQKRSIY